MATVVLCSWGFWIPRGAVLAQEATPASPPVDPALALRAATDWLVDQQLPDGGFPGPSGASDPETTIDVVLALYAAGPRLAPPGVLVNARDFLLEQGVAYAESGAREAARLAMAAIALGLNPSLFGNAAYVGCKPVYRAGSADLVTSMTTAPVLDPLPGIYGHSLRDHALVLLALGALWMEFPETALESLHAAQTLNGGWADDGMTDAATADTQTTALVILSLIQSEFWTWNNPTVTDMIQRGVAIIHSVQTPDGGFADRQSPQLVADAASTALALQALIAAGEDPASSEWRNAPLALSQFQTASGGLRSLVGDDQPDVAATAQVIPALADWPLPVETFLDCPPCTCIAD
jgi:hypothetical protein